MTSYLWRRRTGKHGQIRFHVYFDPYDGSVPTELEGSPFGSWAEGNDAVQADKRRRAGEGEE